MDEAPRTPPNPPAEELHWGISYLREDIQDLRQQMRQDFQDVRQEIQDVRNELRQEIQAVRNDLRDNVRDLHARIDAKFAQLLAAMVGMTGIIIGAVFAIVQMRMH